MSGIEGAEVKIYQEVEKPEALVAEGVTDERGFFRVSLPPAKYIIVVTWIDEEGIGRTIRKEEELTATTELMVNLPAPEIRYFQAFPKILIPESVIVDVLSEVSSELLPSKTITVGSEVSAELLPTATATITSEVSAG